MKFIAFGNECQSLSSNRLFAKQKHNLDVETQRQLIYNEYRKCEDVEVWHR